MSIIIDNPYGRAPLISHASRDEEDFILYQPHPQKQMLLYDLATSFCVLTYLKMKSIPASIKVATNAEFMHSGRLPIVYEKSSEKVMCGFTDVFWHLTRKLNETPSMLEICYMDWVETKFLEFEMYISWCNEILSEVYTRNWYTYDLPWPLTNILFNRKQKQMKLSVNSKFESHDDFMDKFKDFLSKLNKRIGNKPYCLSETSPSCVDALIYGHKTALFKTKDLLESRGVSSPNVITLMVDAITKQRRIVNLTESISRDFPS